MGQIHLKLALRLVVSCHPTVFATVNDSVRDNGMSRSDRQFCPSVTTVGRPLPTTGFGPLPVRS